MKRSEAFSLDGLRIANTRAKHQAKPFSRLIEKHGGVPVEVPLLEILPAESNSAFTKAFELEKLNTTDCVVFTSANAVLYTIRHLSDRQIRQLQQKKIACVGVKTKQLLEEQGLFPEIMPRRFDAEHLAEVLIDELDNGEKILFPRSSLARDVLESTLKESGFQVIAPIAYYTKLNTGQALELHRMIVEKEVDVVPFLSPSSVHAFFKPLSAQEKNELQDYNGFSVIGPITSAALESYQVEQWVIPEEYTTEALLFKVYQKRLGGY
ncbi:uroporphyrinogen-III synthase [Alteribacter populi]|uniref:uroporphyrinogen-III synthase n=1 Tax=Alteribacter populi TaxID=2011011 RepID=UPI000BBB3467|nr:uroporphyrinogen-III synthase [Alteribacter populi]